ncbi:MAG: ECF-type sigma factor [Phycisphaerales bacterium]|nr:ECF-type sigma factor [Phycisphaerales bacterium]
MDQPLHITHFTQMGTTRQSELDGFNQLFSVVYCELEQIAHSLMLNERAGHTLGTHGLISETYTRLLSTYKETNKLNQLESQDLRSLTAVVMRRVLVDHARKRKSRINANDQYAQYVEGCYDCVSDLIIDLITLDDSLIELEKIDPQKARIVELRFFGAIPMVKIAELINRPLRTVERDWSFSRAWLCSRQNSSQINLSDSK